MRTVQLLPNRKSIVDTLVDKRGGQMKKQLIYVALLTAVALIVLVMPASATQPTAVSGEYTFIYENAEMREAGQNCFIEVDATYPFTGDLVGTATAHFSAISHGPCATAAPFANRETLHANGTFTGAVLGKEGTFDFVYEGQSRPVQPGQDALDARFIVLSGTGDLEDLHGFLEASYNLGNSYDTYTGQMHFDPDNS